MDGSYVGAPFTAPTYEKDVNGIVMIRGLVKSGAGVGLPIFNLPVGFRPAGNEIFPVITDTGIGRADVLPNSDVTYVSGGNLYFSLGGISFRAV